MKVVIVGGGAAGASCAARLRRLDENAEITILEATDEISIANCGLPYYCSDVIDNRDIMFVASPATFKNLLNVKVLFNSAVTKIDRENKKVTVNNDISLSYDKLVLALGTIPLKPNIKGIDNKKIFTVKTLADADKIKSFIRNNDVKNAVVIGGGFIGIEMAENFIKLGLNTTLVEQAPQIIATVDSEIAAIAQNELRDKGCKLLLSQAVTAFEEKHIEINSGAKIAYDIAILAIGVLPNTKIAKECGLRTGIKDTLKVNEHMQTCDPDIYAGGDGVEVKDFISQEETIVPLAGPANRQGRIIADNIANFKSIYKGSQGSAVIKIFNKTVASTGLNEKQLLKKNIPFLKNITWTTDHAGYYPGAASIVIKLLFTKDGEILGAQSIGSKGVDKRIDVIASIIRNKGTLQDLLDSELCYAPPYSSAKDPVNIAGMSADNILKGLFKPAFYEDLQDAFLIDARPAEMFKTGTIDGAINIPSTETRNRLNEIPKDKKVIIFCRRGFNSYVAVRILENNGYKNVYSFAGGKNLLDAIARDRNQNK